jgi:hypothetical protein
MCRVGGELPVPITIGDEICVLGEGVLELTAPDFAAALERTVATHQRKSVAKALAAAVDLYRTLRAQVGQPNLRTNAAAEEAAVAYLGEIAARAERPA